jgi:hypothetical protein
MDPWGYLLITRRIQMVWEVSVELCPNWPFKCIDNPERQFVNSSVLTQTRTRSDCPVPLLSVLKARSQYEMKYSQLSHMDNHVWNFTNQSQLRQYSNRTTSGLCMELIAWFPRKISVRNDIQSIISERRLRSMFMMELNGIAGYCRQYTVS